MAQEPVLAMQRDSINIFHSWSRRHPIHSWLAGCCRFLWHKSEYWPCCEIRSTFSTVGQEGTRSIVGWLVVVEFYGTRASIGHAARFDSHFPQLVKKAPDP
ncbi:hypothetical protein AVEN_242543-1 [Araneus ventricosus]|uniref:Uncharacterized protein n=1 Tax=Araneus ventricosus TaxID=182803 RepID=A0A4Y2M181_ARAVE|nr:hypothetical protein AVEN_242543-1 [Araneus ventricosus]